MAATASSCPFTKAITYETTKELEGDIFLFYQNKVKRKRHKTQECSETLKPVIDYTYATNVSPSPTKYDRDKMWEIYVGKKRVTVQHFEPERVYDQLMEQIQLNIQRPDATDLESKMPGINSEEESVKHTPPIPHTNEVMNRLPQKERPIAKVVPIRSSTDDNKLGDSRACSPDVPDNIENGVVEMNPIEERLISGRDKNVETCRKRPVSFLLPVDKFELPDTPRAMSSRRKSIGDVSPIPNEDFYPKSKQHHLPRLPIRPYTSSFPLINGKPKVSNVSIYNKKEDYSHVRSRISNFMQPRTTMKEQTKPDENKLFIKRPGIQSSVSGNNPIDHTGESHHLNRGFRLPNYGRSISLDRGQLKRSGFKIPTYAPLEFHKERYKSPYWNELYYPKGPLNKSFQRQRSAPGRFDAKRAAYEPSKYKPTRHGKEFYANRVPLHWRD